MKKNIDPNKVSNFKNYEPSYHKHSTFCMKTKPNNRYFKGELKRLTQEMRDNFCTEELKKENPAHYYSMMGRKLTKKYQSQQSFFIPSVATSTTNEQKPSEADIRKQQQEQEQKQLKEQKIQQEKIAKKKEEERIRKNQEAAAREQRYIHWVDPFEPINKNKLGSSQAWRIEKKYEYY